jgi:hypothetical protein
MRSWSIPLARTPLAILATLIALSPALPAGPIDERPPRSVGHHEISTRDDLLFAHLLGPLMKGDVARWPILGGLGKQLGDWVD